MKSIDIEYRDIDQKVVLGEIGGYFDRVESIKLEEINWKSYSYKPDVCFKAVYSDYAIYIEYDVSEQSVLALKHSTNDPVYKDSCVEFFLSPRHGIYYNFEFNCIGTKYAGFGESRSSGATMDIEKVEKIRTYSTLGNRPFSEIKTHTSWSLTVEIPFEIFTNKSIDDIKKSSMKGNFYKCGDELSEPHFVSWNSIKTDNPDFHRPDCFGVINFK